VRYSRPGKSTAQPCSPHSPSTRDMVSTLSTRDMDEEYSYEVRRGRSFDEDPEFNDNYAGQEIANHESLMEPELC